MTDLPSTQAIPPELENLVYDCLQAADPEAELVRRTSDRPNLQAMARRMMSNVLASERDHASSTTDKLEIPSYRLLRELGSGGMGTVYLAEQRGQVRRRVAIKVIKLGMDTRSVLARFEAERQALALMDHSAIAKVYDAGATPQGRPYFVMEYVKGLSITRYCDENKLSIDDRLHLFKQVCAGVQHAHTKGVIHRDLTPNNVLVTVQEGKPMAKIIDFGLARATDHRLTEKTLYTEQGVILGTPEYMSPEQAGLDSLDIDMRSDVYSLGVMLFELLTGSPPFARQDLLKAGYDGMCSILRKQDPERPSSRITRTMAAASAPARHPDVGLLRRLRSDLDWVVLKCLEKDRTRRYETVSQLAEDVQRHLDLEPVLARAPSLGYRLGKMARRYRAELVGVAAVAAAVIAGLVGVTWFWLQARHEAQAAETARGREATKAKEAAGNARALAAKVREFDQLAGIVLYEQAVAAEHDLYPPWPAKAEPMQQWLRAHADPLLSMRPEVTRTVAELGARALPATPADAEADRTSHPQFKRWQNETARLASLRRAHAIRTGAQQPNVPPTTAAEQALTTAQLSEIFWPRVTFDESQRTWGEEARALALAQLALEKAKELPAGKRSWFADGLAWALFANGLDAAALSQEEAALEMAPAERRPNLQRRLAKMRSLARAARGDAGLQALAEQEAALAKLAAEVSTRRTYRFPSDRQMEQFLHRSLSELLAKLTSLETTRAAVDARLGWAQRIAALTLHHPKSRVTWQQAREAIAKADGVVASTLYKSPPIDLAPQMGLVPIGMNPKTKLWEFYDLRSAWDPRLGSDPAELAIPLPDEDKPRMDKRGLVFVLIPGGKFAMGAQSAEAAARNYDAWANDDEQPVCDVELAPFFLSRFEMTQGQWSRLTGGEQPSSYRQGVPYQGIPVPVGETHPVENVSWTRCNELLTRNGLVLPTEAQWEYACRGLTATPWFTGTMPDTLEGFVNIRDQTGQNVEPIWEGGEAFDDRFKGPAPVGTFQPNAFGLYDVLGNVWEWCRDPISTYNAIPAPGDGLRPPLTPDANQVRRGGSYGNQARQTRCTDRSSAPPLMRDPNLGVRPARPVTN